MDSFFGPRGAGPGRAQPRTAVLMRDVGIGDLVWHAPYFSRIAAASDGGQVTLLVPPSTHARELLAHEPWVREIVDFDRRPRGLEGRCGGHTGAGGLLRFARGVAAGSHDRVVLFTDRPLAPAFACWWAGVPQRVGFASAAIQRWMLTDGAALEPQRGPGVAAYRNATLLACRHGWCEAALVPRLSVRPDALARLRDTLSGLPRPLRAIAVGSSEANKQWGAARFASLVQLFAQRGDGVVVLGGPAERDLAQGVVDALPEALRLRAIALTGGSIADTVAAMALADACVGNDTGASNIAAAVGTPTWVVLGPRPELRHDPERLRMIRGNSLHGIEPAQVFAQVLAQETARDRPGAPGSH